MCDEYRLPIETAQKLLDEIDQHGKDLTRWEAEFVEGLLKQTDEGRRPSNRQTQKIINMHADRVTSNG